MKYFFFKKFKAVKLIPLNMANKKFDFYLDILQHLHKQHLPESVKYFINNTCENFFHDVQFYSHPL